MRLLSVLVLLGLLLSGCKRKQNAAAPVAQPAQESSAATPSNAVTRPVYAYSVIPGGIQSKQELLAAIRRDPVVARHYSGVDVSTLKPARLERAAFMYVSFRQNEKVYWTSRKVKLTEGETIFQSKNVGVRGRCGNQLSAEPRSPNLPNPELEPTAELLDTPTVWETAERDVLPADPTSLEAPDSSTATQTSIPAGVRPVNPPSIVPVWNGGNWTSGGSALSPGSNGGSGGSPDQPQSQESIPPPTIGPVIPPIEIFPIWSAPIYGLGLFPVGLPGGTGLVNGVSIGNPVSPVNPPTWIPIPIPVPIIQPPLGQPPTGSDLNSPGPPPPVVPPRPPALPAGPAPVPTESISTAFTAQVSDQAIPEPATWILAVCGLLLVFISRVAR